MLMKTFLKHHHIKKIPSKISHISIAGGDGQHFTDHFL